MGSGYSATCEEEKTMDMDKTLNSLLDDFPEMVSDAATRKKYLKHFSKLKPGHENFVSYHREKVRDTLEKRKVCPQCGIDGKDQYQSYMKCSKCKAVSYCSKKCQVADWPMHKKICKIYQHVFDTLLCMENDSLMEFLASGSSECLAVILNMEGFQAEVILCALDTDQLHLEPPGLIVMPAVIAEEKLFNIQTHVANVLRINGVSTRDVQAIPKKYPETSELAKSLFLKQARHTLTPWSIPDDIDEADHDAVKRYTCRFLIHTHYMNHTDKATILKLYGKYNTIKEAIDETPEEFKKRIDKIFKIYGRGFDAKIEVREADRVYYQRLNIKKETRRKISFYTDSDQY